MYYNNVYGQYAVNCWNKQQCYVLFSWLISKPPLMRYPLISFSFFPKTYHFKIILPTQVVKTDLRLWGLHKLCNRWANRKYNFCNDKYTELVVGRSHCIKAHAIAEHRCPGEPHLHTWSLTHFSLPEKLSSCLWCIPPSDFYFLLSPQTSSPPPHSHPQQLWPYLPFHWKEKPPKGSSCKLAPLHMCPPCGYTRDPGPSSSPGKCKVSHPCTRSQPFLPLLWHSSSCSPQSCATPIFSPYTEYGHQKTTCSLVLILGEKNLSPQLLPRFLLLFIARFPRICHEKCSQLNVLCCDLNWLQSYFCPPNSINVSALHITTAMAQTLVFSSLICSSIWDRW